MTDREILSNIAKINYACLYGQHLKFGPGELAWRKSLRAATTEQRVALVAKLQKWNERRSA